MMDEIWERAVVTALDGQTDMTSVRALTLDGAVKCVHGRLPHPSLFQKFTHLQHLSLANIGVSSLEQFPNLNNLQKLILSDNRIATGLEYLVSAGLESLRDLDLSNNRISDVEDLRPLAELKIVSLDLYECPVTRVKDYRSRVFGLIKSLKYLDKMDVDENERPESDDEEDEDDDEEGDGEEEDEEEDDPGSGEIDGEEKEPVLTNGHVVGNDGVVDVDEDDESDADEEESEIVRGSNGASVSGGQVNGFHSDPVDVEEDDEDGDGEGDEEGDGESDEIDEEDGEDEEDVIEVHESDDSEDEEDGVEDDDDEDADEDEEVDNDDGDGDVGEPGSTGWVTSTEGEIDGHEQGEDDVDEDDDGETGEEEIGVGEGDFEDDEEAEDECICNVYLLHHVTYIYVKIDACTLFLEEEDEDGGTGYLVQPVGQVSEDGDEEDDPAVDEEEEIEEDDNEDDEENEVMQRQSNEKGLDPCDVVDGTT
ncbi:Leucine-rich repeat-containing protein [Artemisia annua]|uniref:Leucine-rich repeat-containing protein n=1 Tax=Artemisia annua TaxID=35608 RepID=A0A2U1N5M8_ARTAN|nr:Leucine-rich repeat-containing protein [Artemisia annua]